MKEVPSFKCRCRPNGSCLAGLKIEEIKKSREQYWLQLQTERERRAWLEAVRKKVAAVSRALSKPPLRDLRPYGPLTGS